MRCVIWYSFYNLKNVKNTHGGMLLFVIKSNTPPWVFFMFFELCKWYQITQRITDDQLNLLSSVVLAYLQPSDWMVVGMVVGMLFIK